MSELVWAAKRGDLRTIDAELARGASMAGRVPALPGDWTALPHGAASRACSDEAFRGIVERAVRAGAFEPRQAAEALHEAARRGAVEKVRALLAAGADPSVPTLLGSNVLDTVPYHRTEGARSALAALLSALPRAAFDPPRFGFLVGQAVSRGNRGAIDLLLEHGGERLGEAMTRDLGPVHAALLRGDRALALEGLASIAGGGRGTVLHSAASLDEVEVVAALLDLGAPVDVADVVGDSPLTAAAEADAVRAAALLLDRGATLDHPGHAGWTPLYQAAEWGNAYASALLLDRGASLVHVDPDDGEEQPIVSVAAAGALPAFAERGIDLEQIGPDGYWPLKSAAEDGDVELVRNLLDRGVNPNRRQEGIDETALHVAASHEEAETVALLLERGADPNIDDLDGDRPLDLAKSRHLKGLIRAVGGTEGWSSDYR